MRLIRWLGVMAIVGVTPPARADILVWRDSAGISHYTNDLANVPPEYRDDAMTVAKDWAHAASPPEPAAAGVPVPLVVDRRGDRRPAPESSTRDRVVKP
jgi:hypothetical protein